MAGIMLAEAMEAGRAYREAGNLADSEDLFNVFLAAFKTSPLAIDDKVTKLVDIALRQARIVGAEAPPFEGAEYLEMTKESVEELRGRIVLLDFFAHWCKPCIAEFPKLNALKEKYGPQGLQIVGVTTYYGFVGDRQDVSPADELAALKTLHTQYNVKFGFTIGPHKDEGQYGVAAAAYFVTLLPTTALIDRNGKVRYLRTGANMAEVEKMIQVVLSERPGKQRK